MPKRATARPVPAPRKRSRAGVSLARVAKLEAAVRELQGFIRAIYPRTFHGRLS